MKNIVLFFCFIYFVNAGYSQVNEEWKIQAKNIQPNNYYGETVANGMIGIVSSPQPFSVKEIVVNGAFDQYGRGQVSNILKVFNFVNLNLDIDGKRIEHLNQVKDFTQELNMKEGSFRTIFSFDNKAKVKYTYYTLRQLPYNALVDVEIEAEKDIEITPASVIEAPDMLRDVQNYYSQIDRPHTLITLQSSIAKSPTGKLTIAACNSFIFPDGDKNISLVHEMWDDGKHLVKFKKQLKSGEKFHFAIIGATMTSAQSQNPLNEAQRLTLFAQSKGLNKLLTEHTSEWKKLWESDIEIEGDPQAQKELRSMIYHLYAFTRDGTNYGLSPMGLSGLGYNGHSFWDTEIWMYPAILLLHPEMAKSLLEYRYQRLDAARKNAQMHGYKGAMFPWESADSGEEETPVWALSGPFEHHISADIAMAAWNYFLVTRDTTWLRDKGYALIKETADFWKTRVEKDSLGKYVINNVVAADEWAENVDNNAYTNAACIANLKIATKASKILQLSPDVQWMTIASNIRIDTFSNGVIKEYTHYNGEKIKQADVNLLSYPLKFRNTSDAIRKDLEYYEPRVGEGPAMTHAIFALLYARLQDPEKAIDSYLNGYRANLLPPFGVIAETAGGSNPYFATGVGGMIQAVINGFGGLDITENGIIQLKTHLPKAWKALRLKGIGTEKKTYEVRSKK